MTKKIKVTGRRARTIRSTTVKARSVEPQDVARALGGEILGPSVDATKPMPRVAGLRQRLFSALKSSGGRPSLQGTDRRQKIPMSDADWKSLEAIAASLASEGIAAAPGQVASQLLHDAIQAHQAGGESTRGGAWRAATPETLGVAEPRALAHQEVRSVLGARVARCKHLAQALDKVRTAA
jgi:hypothetical protein